MLHRSSAVSPNASAQINTSWFSEYMSQWYGTCIQAWDVISLEKEVPKKCHECVPVFRY